MSACVSVEIFLVESLKGAHVSSDIVYMSVVS